MKFLPFITAAFFLLSGSATLAQEPSPAKESPPEPPLIAKAAANSQWTITYKQKAVGKGSSKSEEARSRKLRLRYNPLVQTRRVLKGSEQMVIYTSYEAGLKSEAWVVAGYLYRLPMREGEGITVESRTQGDFPEIYWITAANFRGTVPYKGRKVHLYETDATGSEQASAKTSGTHDGDGGKSAKPTLQRAYIDEKTRLPIEVETGGGSWSYQFTDAPSPFPTMDARVAQQLKPAKE